MLRQLICDVAFALRERHLRVVRGASTAQLTLIDASDKSAETMTEDLLTIREMCETYDVTPRTLRFYEAKELLFPIREGQKRLFTKRDRARLKLILRGKRFGFSLEEIRQLLDLYHVGDQQKTQMTRTFEIARERLVDMEARREELTQAIDDLKEQLRWGEKVIASMKNENKAAE